MAATLSPLPSTSHSDAMQVDVRLDLVLRSYSSPSWKHVNSIAEDACPGYCGRTTTKEGNLSSCMACPWGSRVETGALCSPCEKPIETYAWLYLFLVAITPCLFHCVHVRKSVVMTRQKHPVMSELAEHMCILLECFLAALATILVFEPFGQLQLHGCTPTRMKQWYTWMHNPTIRFSKTLPCVHEVVYPLQSAPLVYLGFCLTNTLVLRTVLYAVYARRYRTARSLYAALFTLPLLGVLNVLASGIIYHVFPYVIAIYALGGQAVLFAYLAPVSRADLWRKMFKTPRELTHMLVLMGMFAFSIIAIMVRAGPDDWMVIGGFLGLVIAPPIFFSLTTVLTHPTAVNSS